MDSTQAVLVALLAAIAGLALFRLLIDPRETRGRHAPLPPSASGLPFIGDTFAYIAKGPAEVGRPHHTKLGAIYRAWFLGDQLIHVGDVESARRVLNAEHDLVEEEMLYSVRELLGPRSISTIYGKSHAQMRKVLNPFFTPKAMAAYTHRLAELATEVCSEMAAAGQTKGEDGMKKFAFKANTELILGFEPSAVTDELVARQQRLWQDWLEGLVSIPINLPGFKYHKAKQARNAILAEYHGNIVKLIKESSSDDNRTDGSEARSPMQLYVQAVMSSDDFDKEVFDMEHFVNTTFNLMFAGHDTSASVMVMLLRYLKLYPGVLQKLREEQRKVMDEHGEMLTPDAAAAMPYADAAVKEALRLAPIIAVVVRVALKTFELGGFTIPKGHKLSIELWRIMEEDPRWKDVGPEMAPTKFNPDRWLTEEGHKAGSWMPFSSGPRMCVGFNFALREIKIMLAVLSRGYDWEIDPEEPVKAFPLPMPAQGLPMTFTKLQKPVVVREE